MAGMTAAALTLPAAATLADVGAEQEIRLVETIEIRNGAGDLIHPPLLGIDPGLRVLVTIPWGEKLFLIDLDSLEVTRTIHIPGFHELGPGLGGGAVSTGGESSGVTLDPLHHVAYLSDGDPDTGRARIWAVSLIGQFEPSPFQVPSRFVAEGLSALGYHAPRDLLYVTTSLDQGGGRLPSGVNAARAGHPMTVHQIDARKLRSGDAQPIDWSYPVPACNGQTSLTANYTAPGFVSRGSQGDFVFFPCEGSTEETFNTGAPGGSQAGIVRLDVGGGDPSGFGFEFHPFGVALGGGRMAGDAANDVMYVVDTSQNKLWAFDAWHRAWIGSIPYPPSSFRGFGFDPRTGRVYFATAEQMFVTEGRSLPLPQGTTLSWPRQLQLGRSSRMIFDPERRRLFTLGPLGRTGRHTDPVVEASILVFEDDLPIAKPFELPDPDLATRDLAEVPGKTVSTFSAHGTAFGARYLLAGGARSLTAGTAGGNLSFAFQFPFHQGTRDVMLGRVSSADLDSSAASASAASASVDTGTESDLAQIESPELGDPVPGPASEAVSAAAAALRETPLYDRIEDELDRRLTPATCQDFGGQAGDTEGFGTAVACDLEASTVTASAVDEPSMTDSPIRVAYATSEVHVRRDPDLGSVVEAAAEARGVDILDRIHIGYVRQEVSVAAHGRPGSATSEATSLLREVRLTDAAGQELFACGFGDESCDPFTVAAAINRFFSTRVHAEVPPRAVDPLLAASPGGAQAAVIKDPWRFWNDQNSNEDSGHEVAALQITIYHDTIRPSREVIQLAAIQADAHYAIAPAARAGEGGETGGGGPLPPVGLPTGDPLPTISPPPPPGDGPPQPVIMRVVRGARFLLQSPRDAALMGLVWALLFAPVYLLIRRRQLAARAFQIGGMS